MGGRVMGWIARAALHPSAARSTDGEYHLRQRIGTPKLEGFAGQGLRKGRSTVRCCLSSGRDPLEETAMGTPK